MRLGGPVFKPYTNPEEWVQAIKALGYRAAYCPVDTNQPADVVKAYEDAARAADIVIAEVGAWSNPISPDEATRRDALDKCKKSLALADQIGARCCVNIAGSRGENWCGPDKRDLTEETFTLIVDTVRDIIDSVNPTRSFYSLETMQWMYPDSTECYLRLVKAIDRKGFAVHFDPVNLICSPQRYFANADVIRDAIAQLGPFIRSCHAKDILLHPNMTVHLDEVRAGLGGLDYPTLLTSLNALEPDTPVMLEHLASEDEYALAAAHVRSVAAALGLTL